jgi:iduronate 2-sulfatase
MIFRRLIILTTFASAIIGSALHAAERPNVLLILVDDLKPSFGAYGDSFVHSPNLDRLASRGTLFKAAYCNQAVCAPSRVNLMVGSRSTSTGVYSLSVNFRVAQPDAVTLPQHFMNHGYHASGMGKIYHVGHGNTGDEASWSEPFSSDKVIDYVLPESTNGQLTREQAYFSNQALDRIGELPRGAAFERTDVPDDAYADGRIANEAIIRLQRAARSAEPFFLAVGFVKPHLPFCAPEKYWALYDDADLPIATVRKSPRGAPPYAGKPKFGELNQYKPVPESPPMSTELERTLVQGYYASLSYMDAQLGRVLDELERLDLAKNTIVVLWGDHGYHLGDHGMWTKHTNYEQANHIPLIFAGPGVMASATNALAETVDIYPTLAELAGLPRPEGPQPIDGASLVPVLRDPQAHVRDHAYHAFPRQGNRLGRAIRTDRYRLVEWKVFGEDSDKAVFELYDYKDDPLETRNLAGERPDIVQSLRELLAQHPEALPPR